MVHQHCEFYTKRAGDRGSRDSCFHQSRHQTPRARLIGLGRWAIVNTLSAVMVTIRVADFDKSGASPRVSLEFADVQAIGHFLHSYHELVGAGLGSCVVALKANFEANCSWLVVNEQLGDR
jgi:hypothetical protein